MPKPERILVKLTPKASKSEIKGWYEGPEGEKILKACVTAVAEKGKANEALIKLLAKYFSIPKSNITLLRGETSRVKTFEIQRLITIFFLISAIALAGLRPFGQVLVQFIIV